MEGVGEPKNGAAVLTYFGVPALYFGGAGVVIGLYVVIDLCVVIGLIVVLGLYVVLFFVCWDWFVSCSCFHC